MVNKKFKEMQLEIAETWRRYALSECLLVFIMRQNIVVQAKIHHGGKISYKIAHIISPKLDSGK